MKSLTLGRDMSWFSGQVQDEPNRLMAKYQQLLSNSSSGHGKNDLGFLRHIIQKVLQLALTIKESVEAYPNTLSSCMTAISCEAANTNSFVSASLRGRLLKGE